MTIADTAHLAVTYIRSHSRRYVFLLAILGFSFAIITTITSLTAGMSRNVFAAAENHYGGHVFVIGFENGRDRVIDTAGILDAVHASGFACRKVALRTMGYAKAVLHFAGAAVKQKYVFGIDWENEKADFRNLDFSSGRADFEELADGIIVSSSTAAELQVRVGDDLTLEVPTAAGQKNTGRFIVRGIVRDNSIFGYYKCFISRSKLNALFGFPPTDCSWIGFYFDDTDPASLFDRAQALRGLLSGRFPIGTVVNTREDFAKELSASGSAAGFRYSIVTLTAYISQVADLLSAMKIISYALYAMMLVIALASIAVTYRLILHERSREIATVRVMGLSPFKVQAMLVIEYLLLFTAALVAGFALALFFSWILSLFSYSWIPSFEIFLRQGRLTADFPILLVVTNVSIMLLTTLPAIWLPAAGISRAGLAGILQGGTHAG
jgi:putative ABC transport system permease protein